MAKSSAHFGSGHGQNFWYMAKSSAHFGPQGRTFGIWPKVLPILRQARAELLVYGQKFCPFWARPGQNFWYIAKSFAHFGPGQGRNFGIWQKVLPILGQARAELLAYGKKFCPFWARPVQNFWYMAKSSAHFGPGQGKTFGIWPKVLPILGQARAGQKFCPFWARSGQ